MSLADLLGLEVETQDPSEGIQVHYVNQSNITDGTDGVRIAAVRRFADIRPDFDTDASKAAKTDDIDLSMVPEQIRPKARALFRKHETLWSGHIGNIREAKHYIYIVLRVRAFCFQPYRADYTQRELEA